MEGLIPYVFRAFKRKKAQRYYTHLSSGAPTAKPEDGVHRYTFVSQIEEFRDIEEEAAFGRHRKHSSMEEFTIKPSSPTEVRRFGSMRFIGCVAGI
ncbi:uncharacterized protein LOC110033402 [Phalaenopsis equestris]|uniref:uncharacterized protein LOC110033402 n=1 Tax=Phalaenopsis equestris TaxID=78828 RepID=UPI0009E41B51|nr:uncharacterized protein LOC110033402 [Phalaenopsis equestris]